jgi:glycosyltransferase involved in cell wall biosynthesis
MNEPGKISILMPAYNCEKFIVKAIQSVVDQTYSNWELLVADDKSTDRTKELIDQFQDERIKTFHNETNLGYLKTCNKVFEQSQGDFVSFQDADDYAAPNRFEKLMQAFQEDDQLMAVGSAVTRVTDEGEIFGELQFAQDHKDIRSALPAKFECVGSALMVKRAVTDEFGMYHEFFDRIGSEDLYWFGMFASKYKVRNLKESLYFYRDNPASVSRTVKGNVRKEMSKEFAVQGVRYYMDTGKILFDDAYKTKALESFLVGKGLCWQKEYGKGLKKVVHSALISPFYPKGRFETLKLYLPKLFKK